MTALTPDNEFSLHCTNSMGGHPLSANGVFPVRFSLGDRPHGELTQAIDTAAHQKHHFLLQVQDLTVRYGRKTVVEPMNFSLAQGQTLALVGESGSGKTTTALALCGLLDRKSTRLNSSHVAISYAVFCLKKKKQTSHLEDRK